MIIFQIDTDGVVFDAATVDGEEESDEIEELVEGNESMNDLNDLFINIVTFQFELASCNRNIHATNRVLQYALCS